MRRKLTLTLVFIFLAVSISTAQTAAPKSEKKTDETELRRQTFEKVWSTINEKHFDATFGGLDWKKIGDVYRAKALAAKTRADFYNALREMIGELKFSHFGIYGGEEIAGQEVIDAAQGGGTIGVELKMIDSEAVIARVEKDSTAEKAGLKTGFVLRKIDGKTTAELLAKLEKNLTERGVGERLKNLYREQILTFLTAGKPETLVKIEVTNATGRSQIFEVSRRAEQMEMSEAVGNFPPQEVIFEARKLPENIGYIRFNMWTMPQIAKIRAAVREFSGARGIIFDLRGNPGGLGGLASGVAGLLTKERISLGSMTGRDSELKFIAFPQSNPFTGKIVIISDYGTGSTSEIFAAGLQENGRAIIVGEQSAGAVLPSVFEKLPTGAIFQYAVADYKSPKNVLIEGRGVAPDVAAKHTRKALLNGNDLPLETAVEQILN